jgi:hypothetical protein
MSRPGAHCLRRSGCFQAAFETSRSGSIQNESIRSRLITGLQKTLVRQGCAWFDVARRRQFRDGPGSNLQAHRKKTQAVGNLGTVPTKAKIESIEKQQKPDCHLFESVSIE